MAALRGEEKRARRVEAGIYVLFAAVVLLCGWTEFRSLGVATPLVLAATGAALQLLVERTGSVHRRWWASPAAHLLLLTPFALAGYAEYGLGAVAFYAFATLAAAVEATRENA